MALGHGGTTVIWQPDKVPRHPKLKIIELFWENSNYMNFRSIITVESVMGIPWIIKKKKLFLYLLDNNSNYVLSITIWILMGNNVGSTDEKLNANSHDISNLKGNHYN